MNWIINGEEYEETHWDDDKGSADLKLYNFHTSEEIFLKKVVINKEKSE
jgi:hypothetical protein